MSEVTPPLLPHPRRRLLLLGALWAFVLVVLVAFRGAVLPFLAAGLIAYIVAPLVERITRVRVRGRPIPRWVAILVIYAAFFLVIYLFLIALIPQLYRELLRIARLVLDTTASLTPERVQGLAHRAERWFADHGVPVELSRRALDGDDPEGFSRHFSLDLEGVLRDAAMHVSGFARQRGERLLTLSRTLVLGTLATLFGIFFILMVAAFLSIDAEHIRAYCWTLVPPEYAADARTLFARMDRSLSGVVRGQLTICLVNGSLTFLGLVVFHERFAFLLASVATVLALIPIFGTVMSSFPIVLFGLAQSWRTGLGMLLWILGIHGLEAYFLNPRIMGRAARIHPVVVAFVLLAGERKFGLLGGLFAVPFAALLVATFDFVREKAQPMRAT